MTLKKEIIYACLLLCTLASLTPWLISHFSNAINTDIAFLTLSAERMLQGISMSEGYFDTNPPLSIIIQIPAVLISKTGLPLYYATTVYTLTLLILSFIASAALLKKTPNLKDSDRTLILSIFAVMSTIKLGYDFGQKDHILALAMFPLVLLLMLNTQKVSLHRLIYWPVLLAGSTLILIKPHYGLIPAAIFIHRAISQKRLNVILDKDFLCLAFAAFLYLIIIYTFFYDFLSIILPDILNYYASDISPQVKKIGIILIIQALIPLIICQIFVTKSHPLTSIFSIMAILSFIPFILQGKGWAYHAAAGNIFLYCSFGLLCKTIISTSLNKLKINKISNILGLIITLLLLNLMIYKAYLKPNTTPSHSDYQNTELAKTLKECESPCSFFMFNEMINIPHELSIYTQANHVSRFPVYWFLPYFINAENALKNSNKKILYTDEELKAAKQKYFAMSHQDFEKHQPDILIIGHFRVDPNKEEPLDFINYLKKNYPLFEDTMKRYEYKRTLEVDRINYMIAKLPGEHLIRYDIYRKKKAIKETKL